MPADAPWYSDQNWLTAYGTFGAFLVAAIVAVAGFSVWLFRNWDSLWKRIKRRSNPSYELQAKAMIFKARSDIDRFLADLKEHPPVSEEDKRLGQVQIRSLQEKLLNAYKTVCSRYLDGEWAEKKFRRDFKIELDQLALGDEYAEFFTPAGQHDFEPILEARRRLNK